MTDPDDRPRTPTVTAARWRHELAEHVLEELLPAVNSPTGAHATYHDGIRREVNAPYALVWALVDDDGVMVGWGGRALTRDFERIADVLEDLADPERVKGRAEWERREQEKLDAYAALPFPCGRGRCPDRFATQRGLRSHQAAADRRARSGRDWQHTEPDSPPQAPPARPRPALRVVEP